MNLREFYANIRNVLATIEEPFVVLVSKSTGDGGKEGVMNLVKRETAARMIVEGRARLASEDEVAAYFADEKAKRDQAEAERRFNSIRLDFRGGEIVEQFLPPVESPTKPKGKSQK